MENKRSVLVCDSDDAVLQQIESALGSEGYDVDILNDAAELIPRVIRFHPGVVLVNPDMNGFNASDVCKNIIKDSNIPVILLLDPHSTTRAQVDECHAEDVVTKPVQTDLLANLVAKHVTVNQ